MKQQSILMASIQLVFWIFGLYSLESVAQDNFAARCSKELPTIGVLVSTSQSPYTINNSVSSQRLYTMSRKSHSGEYVMGLTARQSLIQVDFEGPILDDKNSDSECFSPLIEVIIQHPVIRVYIGKEFRENSCSYREILSHEMHHVELYNAMLPVVAEFVRDKMTLQYAGRQLIGDRGKTKEKLSEELDAVWVPFIKKELDKIEELQAKIDSDEEYTRVSWVCMGEVQAILGFRH